MREIKFRGMRTDTNEVVYGHYVRCSASQLGLDDIPLAKARVCHVIVVDGMFYHVTDESVGQYTGFRDMNGVEIYDGDVVQLVMFNHQGKFNVAISGAVFFEDGCYRVNVSYKPALSKFDDDSGNKCIVIGNVHQNPELLENDDEEFRYASNASRRD